MVVPRKSVKQEGLADAGDARKSEEDKQFFFTQEQVEARENSALSDDEKVFLALRSERKIVFQMDDKKELVIKKIMMII